MAITPISSHEVEHPDRVTGGNLPKTDTSGTGVKGEPAKLYMVPRFC